MTELSTTTRVFLEYRHSQDCVCGGRPCTVVGWYASADPLSPQAPLDRLDGVCIQCATVGIYVKNRYIKKEDGPGPWCAILPSGVDPDQILPGYPVLLTCNNGYQPTS